MPTLVTYSAFYKKAKHQLYTPSQAISCLGLFSPVNENVSVTILTTVVMRNGEIGQFWRTSSCGELGWKTVVSTDERLRKEMNFYDTFFERQRHRTALTWLSGKSPKPQFFVASQMTPVTEGREVTKFLTWNSRPQGNGALTQPLNSEQ